MANSALRDYIVRRLKEDEMSQRQLANLAGISHATVGNIISFEKTFTPDLDTLVGLAKALRVSPGDLVNLAVSESGSLQELDAEAALFAIEYSRLPPAQRQLISDALMGAHLRKGEDE
jgi:transcriptional regulator with XRE-family HTH domain